MDRDDDGFEGCQLGELARSVDTTTASVTFYLREGLLPPGRKVNQTTAVYDDAHRARLELILGLRGIIGTPPPRIRALVDLIDDPEASLLRVMEFAQTLGSEDGDRAGESDAEPAAASTRRAAPERRRTPERRLPTVDTARAAVARALGWPRPSAHAHRRTIKESPWQRLWR